MIFNDYEYKTFHRELQLIVSFPLSRSLAHLAPSDDELVVMS